MTQIRLLGDVHGLITGYGNIVKSLPSNHYSIALGDIGIGFPSVARWFAELALDSVQHRFFCGNHDAYSVAKDIPHCLGRYGSVPGFPSIFFISGAFSIDQYRRTPGIDWWHDEQLTAEEMDECYELYCKTKPEIVLSHECPTVISRELIAGRQQILPADATKNFLQRCLNAHQPREWYFGHHHKSWTWDKNNPDNPTGTMFRCLAELEYIDIDV